MLGAEAVLYVPCEERSDGAVNVLMKPMESGHYALCAWSTVEAFIESNGLEQQLTELSAGLVNEVFEASSADYILLDPDFTSDYEAFRQLYDV